MSREHGLGGLFGQATNSIDGLIHTWMLTRGRFQSSGEQCSTAAFLCPRGTSCSGYRYYMLPRAPREVAVCTDRMKCVPLLLSGGRAN